MLLHYPVISGLVAIYGVAKRDLIEQLSEFPNISSYVVALAQGCFHSDWQLAPVHNCMELYTNCGSMGTPGIHY